MISANEIQVCMNRLVAVDQPHYRPATRRASRTAQTVIQALWARLRAMEAADKKRKAGPRNSLGRDFESVALRIANKAQEKPVVLYLSFDGDFRWRWRGATANPRIRDGELIGTYGPGADWRDILEDLNA